MLTLRWDRETLLLLDQTALPQTERIVTCRTAADVAEAIRAMRVRGAPAIGAAAAYGLVLGAQEVRAGSRADFLRELRTAAAALEATRPTASNLHWALARMLAAVERHPDASVDDLRAVLLAEAHAIADEDVHANWAIGEFGAALIRAGERILTHCNTGSLATVGYGTAFGIIRSAHEQGKHVSVIACETRPALQGARLTTWEALREGIDVTLIADSAAGALMRAGMIDRVIVGADRVAANGDVANKIGTYSLAVLARAHEIPFIVAAPLSTIDLHMPDGAAIPIEERRPDEITHIGGTRIAPEGVPVRNPAFDVTPHHLITAIVTDAGVASPPYARTLRELAAARVGG